MLNILQFILAIIAMALAIYGLVTGDFQFQNYMMLALGLMFLVMGIRAFKEEKKWNGWLFLVTALFTLFVAIQGFIFST